MRKSLLVSGALFVAIIGLISITGCNDESDNLAKAQDCLDKTSDANYSAASECLKFVKDSDSQQANILKCSISFVSGGLTTSKIKEAYKGLDGNTAKNEAVFIGILTLDSTSIADSVETYCKKSEVDGLIYLGSLAKVGTYMMSGLGLTPGTIPTPAQVQAQIATCAATPAGCNPAVVGASVTTIADSYCILESNKNSDVCVQINAAVAAGGGNPTTIGEQLFGFLNAN